MLRPNYLLIVAILFAALVGCSSVGKNFNTSKVRDIENNVTTQTHILDWFGVPYIEGVNNGDVMWTYQFDTYNSLGKEKSKDLVILFDTNNVVKAYRFSSNIKNDMEGSPTIQ